MRTTAFHRALIEPRLLMGLDRSLLGLLVIVAMGLTVATKTLWPIVACAFIAAVLRALFARDPLFMVVYGSYCHEGDDYDPWPARVGGHSRRRQGHGKGLLC